MLRNAGLHPEVIVSGVNEDAFWFPTTEELVENLAIAKASAVACNLADGIVIGCDSLLDLDGHALGKPASAQEAAERWREMRGRNGTLRTGHCVIDVEAGRQVSAVASTTVRFGNPTDAEIDAYVKTDEPLVMAGAFTIEGLGGWFVDSIDGDHNNVIGISLPLLRVMLGSLDVTIPDLWEEKTTGRP